MHQTGSDLTALLERSASEQQGIWGLYTTGVKSFGDMTANIDGYRFGRICWVTAKILISFVKTDRLNRCERFDGQIMSRPDGTESINCSTYSSDDYQTVIDRNLTRAEERDGRRYHCPIEPQLCAPLRVHYAQWFTPAQSDHFISALCK